MKQFRETGCMKVQKNMCQPSVVTPEKVGLLGSPDLMSPDLFLWGYFKEIVYAANPRTPGELKAIYNQ